VFLFTVSVIWGVAGPVIKFTLASFPPVLFLTYRFALASVFGIILLAIRPPRPTIRTSTFFHIFLHSVFTVPLGLGLLFFGFDKTSSLTGTVLSASGPIVVALAGMFALKEHITRPERLGMLLALLGTLIVTIGPMAGGNGHAFISLEGNILIIFSLLSDAAGTVIAKLTLRDRVPAMTLTNISFIIGFLFFLPFLLASYSWPEILSILKNAPLSSHLGVLYMAFISGTLAYTLQKMAMKSIEVGEVAVFNYLFPIWAAPISIFILKETITVPFLLGAAVIAIGVVVAELKRRQKKKLPTTKPRRRKSRR
jgi:drug/metabolite transporter (DMT)-like permease